MSEVTVLGAGSWGTALTCLLAKNGRTVKLWGRIEDGLEETDLIRENKRFLPGVIIPREVTITSDLEFALKGSRYYVIAVPSHIVRDMSKKIKDMLPQDSVVINVAKGIETESLKRLSEVIQEELGERTTKICVLSGPSHAEEVGREIPTAVVVAAKSRALAEEVQDLFMSPKFRVYTNPDMVGIELGAALKNVIALGTGIADGLGLGDNSKAALITRGLAEIARLGVVMGANPMTFAGLTGIGDLVVTCTSMHSRNRRAGIQLGKGVPLKQVLAEMGMVVEGVKAAEAAYALKEKYNVNMPICHETYQVLFRGKDPREGVISLMERQKTHEVEEVAAFTDW